MKISHKNWTFDIERTKDSYKVTANDLSFLRTYEETKNIDDACSMFRRLLLEMVEK